MAQHRLVWREGRRTPIVVTKGSRVRPAKKGEGKVVSSRDANAAEERQIAQGKWVGSKTKRSKNLRGLGPKPKG